MTENCCRLLEKELRGLTELRPIETAPRDGMPVLLFVMGHDLWVGAVYDSDMSDAQSRRPPATHWLPLPVDRQGVYRRTTELSDPAHRTCRLQLKRESRVR